MNERLGFGCTIFASSGEVMDRNLEGRVGMARAGIGLGSPNI